MPRGLRRFQESGQSHFRSLGFAWDFGNGHGRPLNASRFDRWQPFFSRAETYDRFVQCVEDMRRRFEMCIYGYVIMPEHVHLLLSEPPRSRLADAIHYLKLSFAKRLRSQRSPEKSGGFWQKRYYDRNMRSYREFVVTLPSSKSGETWAGFKPRGLEVEQLPTLWVSGDWDRKHRVGVESARRGTEGPRRSASDFPSPRLAPKTGARTWGTRPDSLEIAPKRRRGVLGRRVPLCSGAKRFPTNSRLRGQVSFWRSITA